MPNKPDLSIVIPFFNEEENVERMYDSIVDVVDHLALNIEMIFVDDGSTDGTFAKATSLAARDDRLRVIKFRRNYGQTPAMAAGIDHARGIVIITMDGDLQNDPRDIEKLLDKINEGYDIVVGWRHNRQDKWLTRKLPSIVANRIIGKVTGVPIKDNGCSLKAYRASVIQSIPLYAEMHRCIPAMASIAGARIAEVKVRHHARAYGESKYGLSRIYKVLLDLLSIKTLTGFFSRPAVWFSALGLPCAIIGFTMVTFDLLRLLGNGATSIPIMGTGLLFMTLSIFLFFNGILGVLIYETGDTRNEAFAGLIRDAGEESSNKDNSELSI